MARIEIDTPDFARVRRQERLIKIFTGVVLGGALSAAIATALWSTQGSRAAVRPPAPPRDAASASAGAAAGSGSAIAAASAIGPTVKASAAAAATAVDRAGAISVPLPREDEDTDYEALAREQLDRGELDQALVSLRRQLWDHDPTTAELSMVGRVAHEVHQLPLAEQALLDAIALDGKAEGAEVELARVLLDAGKPVESRVHATRATRLDPADVHAWNVAGRAAMAAREWQRAEALFQRALALDPDDAMVHNNLGLLYVQSGRPKEAIDSLERAVDLFNESVPAFVFNNLGLAYEHEGSLDDARAAFEEALLLDPEYARARVNLDRVLSRLEEASEKASFDTASLSGPEAPDTSR